ncbi:MAG: hypothetical protein MJH09_11825 [Cetobacterium sp.]|jgi:hypothetical protein|nr:hypothetical protein [Cetobacterium sp.]
MEDGTQTAIIISCIGGFIAIIILALGFLLSYWFKKLNSSQEQIITDMHKNYTLIIEHKAKTSEDFMQMSERNDEFQKDIFKEVKDMYRGLNKYIRNVEIKTNKNELDILNLKSENKFIVEELSMNKRRNKK